MAIDLESDQAKHVITEHNNWVNYGNGRGGLHAYTFCGWLYADGRMEGAYIYGDWWQNPDIKNVCPHCVHALTCDVIFNEARAAERATCSGCAAYDADKALGHPAKRSQTAEHASAEHP
ncbi:hypothetical protein [Nonomuraea wenchangensis]|nr:hypothetical protein [Nonomuraea wenchangensis]